MRLENQPSNPEALELRNAVPIGAAFLFSCFLTSALKKLNCKVTDYLALAGAIVQTMRRGCCDGDISSFPCSASRSMIDSITLRPSSM